MTAKRISGTSDVFDRCPLRAWMRRRMVKNKSSAGTARINSKRDAALRPHKHPHRIALPIPGAGTRHHTTHTMTSSSTAEVEPTAIPLISADPGTANTGVISSQREIGEDTPLWRPHGCRTRIMSRAR